MTSTQSAPAEAAVIPQPEPSVGVALQHEIEQFLFFEMRLLDDRRYRDWWQLFADDIRYRMPIRYNRLFREADLAVGGQDELATFDEDKRTLFQRVYRFESPSAWAEDPPSRTRHLIGNVWARPTDNPAEFDVQSAFIVYRNRGDHEVDIWAGRRDDVLRTTDGVWQISRRTILLDQATILAQGLTVFF